MNRWRGQVEWDGGTVHFGVRAGEVNEGIQVAESFVYSAFPAIRGTGSLMSLEGIDSSGSRRIYAFRSVGRSPFLVAVLDLDCGDDADPDSPTPLSVFEQCHHIHSLHGPCIMLSSHTTDSHLSCREGFKSNEWRRWKSARSLSNRIGEATGRYLLRRFAPVGFRMGTLVAGAA